MTAAERTETAIREALADILYAEWLMAGANHDAWLSVANKAIEEVQGQLMADPDLLVDLALEAGGLREWGAWLTAEVDGAVVCNHSSRDFCNRADHVYHPLYRRGAS